MMPTTTTMPTMTMSPQDKSLSAATLMELCALSSAKQVVNSNGGASGYATQTVDESCRVLYDQHRQEFSRWNAEDDDRGDPTVMARRIAIFTDNVRFVYQHNSRDGEIGHLYRLALNQFSDRLPEELPKSDEVENQDVSDVPTVLLDNEAIIQKQAPHRQQANEQHQHQQPQPVGHDRALRTKVVTMSEFRGSNNTLVRVKARVPSDHSSSANGTLSGTIGETPTIGSSRWDSLPDRFHTSLNWASTNNPDGVSVVIPPPQQGVCGGCWAFVATGTLEASVARHQAFHWQQTTRDYPVRNNSSSSSSNNDNDTTNQTNDTKSFTTSHIHKDNVNHNPQNESNNMTRRVERQSLVPLSVQQLLDCDTRKNHGCAGGNPVFSYRFLHQHGITTAARYPYLGYQGVFCRVEPTVAKVQAWGLLPPHDPLTLELVLRHIGPVSVAINGMDPTFLQYKSGIYDDPQCQQHRKNHAVLLVGYGQETLLKSSGAKGGTMPASNETVSCVLQIRGCVMRTNT